MKKIILLFIIVFSFQSCFRVHKAPRIESYKLIPSKLKNGSTSYAFHLDASRISFYPRAQRFFEIKEDYLPESFTTRLLYPEEELEVTFYLSTDQDKKLDLFTATFNSIIGSENGIKGKDISRKGEDVFNYAYVKVKDLEGNDVFIEDDERRASVINVLNSFRNYLN